MATAVVTSGDRVPQTPSTGFTTSFLQGGRCRKAMLGVWVFPNMCSNFLTLLAVITQWKMDRALLGVKRRVHAAFLCPAFQWFMYIKISNMCNCSTMGRLFPCCCLFVFAMGCFDIIKFDGVLFGYKKIVLEMIFFFFFFLNFSDVFLGLVRYFWYHFVNVCRSLVGEVDCVGIYIVYH